MTRLRTHAQRARAHLDEIRAFLNERAAQKLDDCALEAAAGNPETLAAALRLVAFRLDDLAWRGHDIHPDDLRPFGRKLSTLARVVNACNTGGAGRRTRMDPSAAAVAWLTGAAHGLGLPLYGARAGNGGHSACSLVAEVLATLVRTERARMSEWPARGTLQALVGGAVLDTAPTSTDAVEHIVRQARRAGVADRRRASFDWGERTGRKVRENCPVFADDSAG